MDAAAPNAHIQWRHCKARSISKESYILWDVLFYKIDIYDLLRNRKRQVAGEYRIIKLIEGTEAWANDSGNLNT